MVADVPLGAFLSGGIDSSTVVAAMAEASSSPVKTFSIGFDRQPFDELAHARRIAELFETEHHEFVVRPAAVEVLPRIVRHHGEPFADSSAIAATTVEESIPPERHAPSGTSASIRRLVAALTALRIRSHASSSERPASFAP